MLLAGFATWSGSKKSALAELPRTAICNVQSPAAAKFSSADCRSLLSDSAVLARAETAPRESPAGCALRSTNRVQQSFLRLAILNQHAEICRTGVQVTGFAKDRYGERS